MSAAKHGGRGRSRGGHEEEHENHERWMVTYADMLTLLLVLFIVLYAISQVNTSKFAELSSSLSTAFKSGQPSTLTGGKGVLAGTSINEKSSAKDVVSPNDNLKSPEAVDPASKLSKSEQAAANRELDEFARIKARIQSALHASGLDAKAQFDIDERGLVVHLVTDELVFTGNSAVLQSEGATILNAVVPPLSEITNSIQVDGHTNQAAVSTYPYPSGWELSSARASSVVRYLIESGHLSPSRLSAAGYSDQRPLVDPKDPRSITRNRRVDIVVLSNLPASSRAALPSLSETSTSHN